MRLRRSYSTPSDTRPAIRRLETLNASRSSPAAAIAPTSGHRSVRPWRIRSMVRPTRKGMITPAPIAIAASAKDRVTPRRYGRRKPSRRTKTLTEGYFTL